MKFTAFIGDEQVSRDCTSHGEAYRILIDTIRTGIEDSDWAQARLRKMCRVECEGRWAQEESFNALFVDLALDLYREDENCL
jgi:hypothetical protein